MFCFVALTNITKQTNMEKHNNLLCKTGVFHLSQVCKWFYMLSQKGNKQTNAVKIKGEIKLNTGSYGHGKPGKVM